MRIWYSVRMQENIWISWLHKRGITDKVLFDFNIHSTVRDDLGDALVIPINNVDGTFNFNKYRRDLRQQDVKPKYKYDSGSKVKLYGADKIKNIKKVLLTEGELDALVAWSSNIPAVSSTGGASSFNEEMADILKDKDVTICYDNDDAGASGMVRVLKMLPKTKVLLLPDRPGIKDISDYVGGGGNLNEILRTAITFNDIQEIMDNRAERLALWQSTTFHDKYIAEHIQPVYTDTKHTRVYNDNTNKIKNARAYPINRLIEFKRNKALCIWHNEKNPSLTYYPKTNTVYCFGCAKHGDAIDVIRQQTNCSFVEALNRLL